jgi:hypothetical protein
MLPRLGSRLIGELRYRRRAPSLRQGPEPTLRGAISQLATEAQIRSPEYAQWRDALRLPSVVHRKFWEFAYIMQVLEERDLLREGRRGVGFGVGREPLPAAMAARGVQVLATDAPLDSQIEAAWARSGQHADSLAALNASGLCDAALFAERVRFRAVDMNAVPADLRGFDFCWSSCAFEHLGDIERGLRFVERSLDCVVPGGVSVHTTEFNLSSDTDTVRRGTTVIFRRRDFERLFERLRRQGHHVEATYHPGNGDLDRYVDVPPYRQDPHLKLLIKRYVCTSFGLTVTKSSKQAT